MCSAVDSNKPRSRRLTTQNACMMRSSVKVLTTHRLINLVETVVLESIGTTSNSLTMLLLWLEYECVLLKLNVFVCLPCFSRPRNRIMPQCTTCAMCDQTRTWFTTSINKNLIKTHLRAMVLQRQPLATLSINTANSWLITWLVLLLTHNVQIAYCTVNIVCIIQQQRAAFRDHRYRRLANICGYWSMAFYKLSVLAIQMQLRWLIIWRQHLFNWSAKCYCG